MGPEVAVQDRMTFSFDATEATTMAGENPEGSGNADMSLSEITAAIKQIMPAIGQIGEIQKALAALAPAKPAAAEPAEDKEPAAVAAAAPGEGGEGTPAGTAAMDEAAIIKRLASRDRLAGQISAIVGTFDHSEMTHAQVVAYGCEKLGMAKADEGMLAGYLMGRQVSTPAARVAVDGAEPARKAGSFVEKHLKGE